MSDCAPTQRFVREDAQFADLYDRHHRQIRDYCRRRLAYDLVDDAAAEIFLVAWRRIEDVPKGDEALVWLYRVAYRVVGRQWRNSARRARLDGRLRVGDALSGAGRGRVGAPRRRAPARAAGGDAPERRRRGGAASGGLGTALHRRGSRSARHQRERGQATPASRQAAPRPRVPPARCWTAPPHPTPDAPRGGAR